MTKKEFEEIKKEIQKYTNTVLTFAGKYTLDDLLSDFNLWKYAFDNKPEFYQSNKNLPILIRSNIYCFIYLLKKHYFVDGNKRFAFLFLFNNVIKSYGKWLYSVENFDQHILAYIKVLEKQKTEEILLLVFNMLCQNFYDYSTDDNPQKLQEWKKNILIKLAKEGE